MPWECEPLLDLVEDEIGNVHDDVDAENIEEVHVVGAVDDGDGGRHFESLLGNLACDEVRAVVFVGRDEHIRAVRARLCKY